MSIFSLSAPPAGVVIAPLVLGQLCRRSSLGPLLQRVTPFSRTMSSALLLAIVFNIFSDTFLVGLGVGGTDLLALGLTMPGLYLGLSWLFWEISKKFLPVYFTSLSSLIISHHLSSSLYRNVFILLIHLASSLVLHMLSRGWTRRSARQPCFAPRRKRWPLAFHSLRLLLVVGRTSHTSLLRCFCMPLSSYCWAHR